MNLIFRFVREVLGARGKWVRRPRAKKIFPRSVFRLGPAMPLEPCLCMKGPLGISIRPARSVPTLHSRPEPRQTPGVISSGAGPSPAISSDARALRRPAPQLLFDAFCATETTRLMKNFRFRQKHPDIHRLTRNLEVAGQWLHTRLRIAIGTCWLCGGIKGWPNIAPETASAKGEVVV